MSLGLNDRQSVVVGGKVTLDNSPDYPARYKERVTAVLKSAVASRASLLWVGLPAMRDAAPDSDAREKNKLFAEAIAEFGDPAIQYVPPWRLNPTGEDKFASFGPTRTVKSSRSGPPTGNISRRPENMLVAAYLLPKIDRDPPQSGRQAWRRLRKLMGATGDGDRPVCRHDGHLFGRRGERGCVYLGWDEICLPSFEREAAIAGRASASPVFRSTKSAKPAPARWRCTPASVEPAAPVAGRDRRRSDDARRLGTGPGNRLLPTAAPAADRRPNRRSSALETPPEPSHRPASR